VAKENTVLEVQDSSISFVVDIAKEKKKEEEKNG
jgi:hypothetical protein